MHTSPNAHRSPVRDLPAPAAWISRQAQTLATALTAAPGAPVDFYTAAEAANVTISVAYIPRGTDAALAAALVERGLAAAEATIARLRGVLTTHGAGPFLPPSLPLVPPLARRGDTQESYLLRLMRQVAADGARIVRAGSTRIETDPSGAYIAATE